MNIKSVAIIILLNVASMTCFSKEVSITLSPNNTELQSYDNGGLFEQLKNMSDIRDRKGKAFAKYLSDNVKQIEKCAKEFKEPKNLTYNPTRCESQIDNRNLVEDAPTIHEGNFLSLSVYGDNVALAKYRLRVQACIYVQDASLVRKLKITCMPD